MNRTEKWGSVLVAVAGCMGLAGVAVAAAGAHRAGGNSAQIAAEFLLIHAAVAFAAGNAAASERRQTGLLLAASVLAASATLFSADLALAALGGLRPLPLAAPLGGFGMIAGWLLIAVVGCLRCIRKG